MKPFKIYTVLPSPVEEGVVFGCLHYHPPAVTPRPSPSYSRLWDGPSEKVMPAKCQHLSLPLSDSISRKQALAASSACFFSQLCGFFSRGSVVTGLLCTLHWSILLHSGLVWSLQFCTLLYCSVQFYTTVYYSQLNWFAITAHMAGLIQGSKWPLFNWSCLVLLWNL